MRFARFHFRLSTIVLGVMSVIAMIVVAYVWWYAREARNPRPRPQFRLKSRRAAGDRDSQAGLWVSRGRS